MIPTVDRLRRTLVIAGLAALLVAGAAMSSRPCGRDVMADLSDNGRIDRSWNCKCLLDGLIRAPELTESVSLSMREELEKKLRAQCVGWRLAPEQFELTASSPELVSGDADATLEAALTEFNAVEIQAAATAADGGYSVPWEIVVVGVLSGCLAVLIGAAAVRRWRLPT